MKQSWVWSMQINVIGAENDYQSEFEFEYFVVEQPNQRNWLRCPSGPVVETAIFAVMSV